MPTEYPDIFQALARQFPKDCERTRDQGGRTLTYITARSVQNRLDEVIGPENWWPHYEETKDGIKCTITIRLPDGREVAKEDGGGFATAMKAEDDVEKSGYSDALKRAGVAWGVGRYLYKDGVPNFTASRPRNNSPTPGKVTARGAVPDMEPAPEWPPYRRWIEAFCDDRNRQWIDNLNGSGAAPADLVTIFQLNRHLLKFLSMGTSKGDEKANLKAGENAWRDNHEVMAAEAIAYCRKLWKDASAKIRGSREPGADDDMPSDDEHAVLDEIAAKA
jgi:hypothetical protein